MYLYQYKEVAAAAPAACGPSDTGCDVQKGVHFFFFFTLARIYLI